MFGSIFNASDVISSFYLSTSIIQINAQLHKADEKFRVSTWPTKYVPKVFIVKKAHTTINQKFFSGGVHFEDCKIKSLLPWTPSFYMVKAMRRATIGRNH